MNITKEQADKVIAALEVGRIWAECEKQDRSAKFCNEAITIIRGLAEDAEPETAMVDAAMVAMKGIYPPLRRSECQKLIRAAFNATSPQAAQTEAQEREAFEAWYRTTRYTHPISEFPAWDAWKARAGRKG